MKNTVMTMQVEHLTMQVSASCTMIIEDNQALSRAPYPPVGDFHQTTVVKTRGDEHTHTLTHYIPPSSRKDVKKYIYLKPSERLRALLRHVRKHSAKTWSCSVTRLMCKPGKI